MVVAGTDPLVVEGTGYRAGGIGLELVGNSGNLGSGYIPECCFWAGLRDICSFYFSYLVSHFYLSSGVYLVSRFFHCRRWRGWVSPSMGEIL